MKPLLAAAAIYNIAWGAAAVLFPELMLEWLGVDASTEAIVFWQCIGMIVGVYGVGYWIASRDPYRHWPIVLVGLLGKIFGPIGCAAYIANGALPASVGWVNITNDVLWWFPFVAILWGAFRFQQAIGSAYDIPEADDPVRELRTSTNRYLHQLAEERPQLVVFLRHFGCTFCREAMSDLSSQRRQIESLGCGIVLVHLSDDDDADFFANYSLQDLPRIADPECRLYRQFGLDLGGFSQLFGAKVLLRGLVAGLVGGHGIGPQQGNAFQMPGVFLYSRGKVLGGYLHSRASDRPNYLQLVSTHLTAEPLAAAV